MIWKWLSDNEARVLTTVEEKSNLSRIIKRVNVSFKTGRIIVNKLVDKGLLYNIKKFNENEIGLTASGVLVRGLIFKINGLIRK
jgi:predicted transcriptional regulator